MVVGELALAELQQDNRLDEQRKRARFRTRRRGPEQSRKTLGISTIAGAIQRLSANMFANRFGVFALGLLALGPLAILFLELSGASAAIAAFASALAAVLSALISGLLFRDRTNNAPGMQQRFEQLEDMAWELSESEERYRTLAETFGDLLILRDDAGDIIFANKAFQDLALSSDQVGNILEETKAAGQLPPPEPEDAGDDRQFTSHQELENSAGSEICIGQGRSARWFHWVDLPVRDRHGGGTGVLSVAREITAFKQTAHDQAEAREKAEQASRAKSRFLAMVSHEMRTPLNGILGMSRLLSDTGLSPEQANYNQALSRSADALLGLINGMLDMTMIEAGRFKLAEKPFDLAALARQTGEIMAQKAHEKNIEFAIDISPNIPSCVISDPDRIRQIIVNLTGNAVKFTRSGGVLLTLDTSGSNEGELSLELRVRDTGPGITPLDAERIFSEFERAGMDKLASVEGAGLGLAISNALARELGGALYLETSGEDGSVFTLSLPCKTPDKNTNQRSLHDSQLAHRVETGPLVFGSPRAALVLSRNRFEAKTLCRGLTAIGIECGAAIDPLQAFERLKTRSGNEPLIAFFDPAHYEEPKAVFQDLLKQLGDNTRLALCLKPDDREWFALARQSAGVNWLTRPIRPDSLNSLVSGAFANDLEDIHKVWANEASFIAQPEHTKTDDNEQATVLLAEDNDINALLVTSALNRAGIGVVRVENGREAVDRVAERLSVGGAFNVVFMDMQMPVMDGLKAIEKIRALEDGGPCCRIYMLTADEQASTRQRALQAGADEVIIKPLEPAQLVSLCKGEETTDLSAAL